MKLRSVITALMNKEAYFTVIVKEKIPFTSLVNKKYYSHNL